MLLTLPPPQSLDEPRIAPGGPPSLPLLELRRALQTHFGEPSQSSVRWHARFGAHEPVELDSERESMYTVHEPAALQIHTRNVEEHNANEVAAPPHNEAHQEAALSHEVRRVVPAFGTVPMLCGHGLH